MSSAQTYRPDIDGLRAIAVIAVVLFHAEIWPFTGGFVGVDIFFVISGFLITRIINVEMEKGRFSLADFYHRRIRRLFPALFTMLGITLLIGLFVLLPSDLDRMGRNAVGVSLFFVNILYWFQVSYFEADASLKPLLHTWSLAVEEQYYIVFPLILMIVRRYCAAWLRPVVVGIAAASFIGVLWMLPRYPSAAFYLTPFRIWELMIGSIIALNIVPAIRDRRIAEWSSLAGIGMITVAIFLYSDQTQFPGMSALLPCIGSGLLIHAGQHQTPFVNRVIAWRPLVGIGLISYSLYLWHWPVLVFARYRSIDSLTTLETAGLVVLSFVLGWLSWRFVERPFRKGWPTTPRYAVFAFAGTVIVSFCIIGTTLYLAKGFPDRYSGSVQKIAAYSGSFNPETDMCSTVDMQLKDGSPCTIKASPMRDSVFLWGDSHAGALFGAFSELAESGLTTVYGVTPRCPPGLGIGTSRACLTGNDRRLAYLESRPEINTVVIAARWALYLDGRVVGEDTSETNYNLPVIMNRDGNQFTPMTAASDNAFRDGFHALIRRLVKAGKRVVIVYPVPEYDSNVPLTQALMLDRQIDPSKMLLDRAAFEKRQRHAAAMLDGIGNPPGLIRFFPADYLCDVRNCHASQNGKPLYFDSHHLSISGADVLHLGLAKAIQFRPSFTAGRQASGQKPDNIDRSQSKTARDTAGSGLRPAT